jgi:DNA polymerase III subunit alpha
LYYIEEMFCHLSVRSNFSLLQGLSSPADLISAAAAVEMPALGLVDRHMLTGSVEFWLAGRRAGVRPILGLELEVTQASQVHRLHLLAAGPKGWENLCRLSSVVMMQDAEGAPIEAGILAENSADLISFCLDAGTSEFWLQWLKDQFCDRLYAAIRVSVPADLPEARQAALAASRFRVPAVALHPVYYLKSDQAVLQRSVSAIRLITPVGSVPPEEAAPPAAHFLSETEMHARYGEFHGALERTLEVASRCLIELPVGKPHYPRLDLPEGISPAVYLRRQAEEGARRIYGSITSTIQTRLEHELEIISQRGYEPIFLIVKDLLDYARKSDIPTASRGSASSSLVAHCLGITTPDPLGLNLYFERFLNPARETPPDIDTDLCSRGRERVIRYAFERFGADRVAMVATINRFRPKSALADLAKAHGLAPDLVRELGGMLPQAFWSRREEDGETGEKSPFTEAQTAYPRLSGLFHEAESLLKIPRHLSVHPGGLVVAPNAITERMAVMRSGNKGVVITQMDLDSVEALGLVKIDLLGIRGLTVMGDVASAIHSWRRSEFSQSLDVLDKIPEDDATTADCVENGKTIGCFQIESPGMRSVLREIHARTPEDILAALALYRPGPLQGVLKDAFVRRFKGQEEVIHLHPALEPLLAETYGVILYQEQVLRIANQLAGFSLAEADLLRRAMSHFDPGKQMQELRAKFISGAEERVGVTRELGERIWDLMAAFAGYGFPKAHAASYAVVGWRSAWCKTHFPAEFMAAVLANWGGYYGQRVYLSETRRLGLRLYPPNVNHARRQFSVAYPGGEAVLYMGLDQVHDLTARTQERILRGRPFRSLDDFLTRVDPRRMEAENLASAGAMVDFGCAPNLIRRIQSGGWRSRQPGLFDGLREECDDEDWTLEQKCQAQEKVLGVAVDAHPLELVADQIQRAGAVTTVDAIGMVGARVRIAGVRMSSHRSRTAQGGTMLFLTLEDLEGLLDVVFFPEPYRVYRNTLSTGKPLLIGGVIQLDMERGEVFLKADRVDRL